MYSPSKNICSCKSESNTGVIEGFTDKEYETTENLRAIQTSGLAGENFGLYNCNDVNKDTDDKEITTTLCEKVKENQPYFFSKPCLIQKYGKHYYHDKRYPLYPLSIDFLSNENAYCNECENRYPCYVIDSHIQNENLI